MLGPGAAAIVSDPAKLHDILRNLIENAVSYAPEGTTVSIGVAIYEPATSTASFSSNAFLRQADGALYRAKDDGRGCFKFYSDDQTFAAREPHGLDRVEEVAEQHRNGRAANQQRTRYSIGVSHVLRFLFTIVSPGKGLEVDSICAA